MKKKLVMGAWILSLLSVLALSACGKAEEAGNTKPAEEKTVEAEKESSKESSKEKSKEKEAAPAEEKTETVKEASEETLQEDKEAVNPKEMADKLVAMAKEEKGSGESDNTFYMVRDFDGDGAWEAFVFIGGAVDDYLTSCDGTLYYVTEDGCETIFSEISLQVREDEDVFSVYEMENRTFIGVNEAYVTATVTHLFYVDGGFCKESDVSRIGCFFKPKYVEGYGISISAYDAICQYQEGNESEAIYIGHTWKNYYYYYDPIARDFREYGAVDITEEDLKKACGFDLAEEIRGEGFTVDSIIRRDNGIINVNYSLTTKDDDGMVEIDYKNVTYLEKTGEFLDVCGDGEKTLQNSDFGGTYESGFGY